MSKKYKVAYVTGSRADYGIVRNYLFYLNQDKDIDFSLLVTGAHLDSRYGNSLSIIEKDNFNIDLKVNIDIDTTTNKGILKSMAIILDEFGSYFENNKYDLLIILGDRYEMMAVAQAAAMQKIPILHLHGGEVTYGNYDEFIRHCITKMSRYHFASTETYKNRIIQLGENPNTVFNMGALGAENCTNIDENLVAENIKNLKKKTYLVVAFHPETLSNIDLTKQVDIIINTLEKLLGKYTVVLIGTNADTKADIIRNKWMEFSKKENVHYFENLNTDSYLYLLKNSICLLGNSSSGIIEAPSLGIYSINIGDRQKGRVHGESVIDTICDEQSIISNFEIVLKNINMGNSYLNPYYQKNVAKNYYLKTKQILNEIKDIDLKEFYDIIGRKK
ncbi:MAG: UDP-N-acetylglucosamine 2-epimerase (hydrolyzing) [Bacilli bacterium]|nr:UDP-N-acetylglucosamine 2-epimerase (hydrolyzing) [Bacilli bacterium]